MRSRSTARPALAMAWEMGRRHQLGLSLTAFYALAAATIAIGWPQAPAVVGFVTLHFGLAALLFLLAAFSHGIDADAARPESAFPARLFALPVPTRLLAGLPLALGAAALAAVWCAGAPAAFRPIGVESTPLWPVALLVLVLTVLQATTWWPFPAAWLRGVVAAPSLAALAAIPYGVALWGWSPTIVTPALVIAAALIHALTVVGLTHARSGGARQWTLPKSWSDPARRKERRPFPSASAAQVWYEWRRHGLVLPTMVGAMLPLGVIASLWMPMPQRLMMMALGCFGLIQLAGSAGATVPGTDPWARDFYGVPPFTACRPVGTGALAAAKLISAAWSVLYAWGLTLGINAVGLVLSGTSGPLFDGAADLVKTWGAGRFAATVALVAVGVPLLAWKRVAESLCVGVTGRKWMIQLSTALGAAVPLVVGLPIWWLYYHPEWQPTARAALPWALGGAAVGKLALAGLMVRPLSQYLAAGQLVVLGIVWLGVAATYWALLAVAVPMLSGGMAASAVVLLMPLIRVSAMPFALEWNRHR